jgi:serine/threonine protein kinase
MSPEQVNGKKVDGRADIFSLGVTLYELLIGEKPFAADTIPALLYRIANVDHTNPREFLPTISDEIVRIINLSLEKSLELEKKNSELQNQKVNVVLEQNLNLTKSLNEERSMSNWERILWFGLGVVGTGMAVYGASKIAK